MSKYAIGLDFGTNSCRSLLVDLANGKELATHVFPYPSGRDGVIVDPADPNLARQNPADYVKGIEATIKGVLKKAKSARKNFSPFDVIGIGVDTTGSSPMPVDARGNPLCFNAKFRKNPAAMVWLWKDHTSYAEAHRSQKQRRSIALNTWQRSAASILQNGIGAKFFTAKIRLRKYFKRPTVLWKFVIGFLPF